MAEKKIIQDTEGAEAVVAKAKDFWDKYSKYITGVAVAVIVLIGGFYVYKNLFKGPKERKATDSAFMAEYYFGIDSLNQALNGDGPNPGFLKVIKNYGGTDAGNLANLYAGICYIKLNENEKAAKHLKKFSTSSKPVQALAYKLLGDAYGDAGKNAEALSNYKKAAREFEDDKEASAEALFSAAYLAQTVLKDNKQATELYRELKEKFPLTNKGRNADLYLAQMGVVED